MATDKSAHCYCGAGDHADALKHKRECELVTEGDVVIERACAPHCRWKRGSRHAFEAIQLGDNGAESLLDTFTVTRHRNADEAYEAAESLCELARRLPHKPAAFVREINAP